MLHDLAPHCRWFNLTKSLLCRGNGDLPEPAAPTVLEECSSVNWRDWLETGFLPQSVRPPAAWRETAREKEFDLV